MTRPVRDLAVVLLAMLVLGLGVALAGPASANPLVPDCTEAPAPEVPGRGVVGFFDSAPGTPPPALNPFEQNASTSIYEQYGYAGLRWNTYDLGCGPDVARAPDAVVGTAVANWMLNLPKAAVAATGGILDAAFDPTFLQTFDPLITQVVAALRTGLFDQWVFLALAATGALLVLRARRASLASSAAAIGWAMLVLLLATAVFRWPLAAGHAADETMAATLGAVTSGLNGTETTGRDTSTAAEESTSSLYEAVLWQAWLGGTFGSPDSDVARTYGPSIFDAQALTWREAEVLRTDPQAGAQIIEAKQAQFAETAAKVKAADPDAYEYLMGKRSDARVGYALLASLAALCAVPFLVMSALLVLGALIIVRFGVMLFPAFATLGLFPTMRGLVTGVANTLAAAVINATIFGVGAAVMVTGLDVLLDPATGLPGWLVVVLSLLLTIVMWVVLRPFRRLTRMVSPRHNVFGEGAGAISGVGRSTVGTGRRLVTLATGSFLGNTAATKATQRDDAQTEQGSGAGATTERAEAASTGPVVVPSTPVATLPAASVTGPASPSARSSSSSAPSDPAVSSSDPPTEGPATQRYETQDHEVWRPTTGEETLGDPVEPEDVEGDQVYVIYRPGRDQHSDTEARSRV